MSRYVHEYGGRWWERPVCWLSGLLRTLRFGVVYCGHDWREAEDSRGIGQHLICGQCGRHAVEYDAEHERGAK